MQKLTYAMMATVLAVTAASCSDDREAPGRPRITVQPKIVEKVPLPAIVRHRKAVFAEEFDRLDLGRGRPWGWQSGAYSHCRTNRENFKLDLLKRRAMRARSGALTITATPTPAPDRWRTGLIATGESCGTGGSDFLVRTGDVLLAHVRLPTARTGAWPGIWTWRDGRNEIDLFEWHADAPGTLELVNHVTDSARYWSSPIVRRGAWLYVAAHFGARHMHWYVGESLNAMRRAHSDDKGAGKDFRAHLVANLSVDDGRLHARPDRAEPFSFTIDFIRVYRRP
ncbi:LamG domain-containing protein [Actinomadura macrotermitis]|uniref:hypothetical protein n=1 Tax=Actinomadura macrotermitis TaxID=2585200 RepID=UPI002E25B4D0